MSTGKITAKQQEILEYIKEQILKKGYPPAVRDLRSRTPQIHLVRTRTSGNSGEKRIYPQGPDETACN